MIRERSLDYLLAVFVISLLGASLVLAQSVAASVQWHASARREVDGGNHGRAVLALSAVVPDGWHVYALNQVSGGPTPLHIELEAGSAVRLIGTVSGTVPEKRHDASFDLDTEFYTHAFTLRFPLESNASFDGPQSLQLSVRFQLCSERECQPPKTIHLRAPIEAPLT